MRRALILLLQCVAIASAQHELSHLSGSTHAAILGRHTGHAPRQQTSCSTWIHSVRKADKKACCAHDPTAGGDKASVNRTYSQGHQDGILREIFGRIGVTNKVSVEFGFDYAAPGLSGKKLIDANNGLNTRLLHEQGWNSIYFDAVLSDAEAGIKKAVLTEDNIVSHFKAAGVPNDVDYVSIDVDSVDVWLMHGLLGGGYRPRVLSVEFNSNFMLDQQISCEHTWHEWTGRTVYGASLGAINAVAEKFNYRVVHVMNILDVFFVRQEDVADCGAGTLPTLQQAADWYGPFPRRLHRTCTAQDAARLVDVPLSLAGKKQAAHTKAIVEVRRLDDANPDWANSRFGRMCEPL